MGYPKEISHEYVLKLIEKTRPWAMDGKEVDASGFLVGLLYFMRKAKTFACTSVKTKDAR